MKFAKRLNAISLGQGQVKETKTRRLYFTYMFIILGSKSRVNDASRYGKRPMGIFSKLSFIAIVDANIREISRTSWSWSCMSFILVTNNSSFFFHSSSHIFTFVNRSFVIWSAKRVMKENSNDFPFHLSKDSLKKKRFFSYSGSQRLPIMVNEYAKSTISSHDITEWKQNDCWTTTWH